MTDEWTITLKQLNSLRALVRAGRLRTGGKNTGQSITYGTAEALERRGLVEITVDHGDYLVLPTDAGRALVQRLEPKERRDRHADR